MVDGYVLTGHLGFLVYLSTLGPKPCYCSSDEDGGCWTMGSSEVTWRRLVLALVSEIEWMWFRTLWMRPSRVKDLSTVLKEQREGWDDTSRARNDRAVSPTSSLKEQGSDWRWRWR